MTQAEIKTKTLFVVSKGGNPKGIFSESTLRNYSGKRWWDNVEKINVPLQDYEQEKVTVSTIGFYLKNYKA